MAYGAVYYGVVGTTCCACCINDVFLNWATLRVTKCWDLLLQYNTVSTNGTMCARCKTSCCTCWSYCIISYWSVTESIFNFDLVVVAVIAISTVQTFLVTCWSENFYPIAITVTSCWDGYSFSVELCATYCTVDYVIVGTCCCTCWSNFVFYYNGTCCVALCWDYYCVSCELSTTNCTVNYVIVGSISCTCWSYFVFYYDCTRTLTL